jgi:hypothetical protein
MRSNHCRFVKVATTTVAAAALLRFSRARAAEVMLKLHPSCRSWRQRMSGY